jgi:hypothetical protein
MSAQARLILLGIQSGGGVDGERAKLTAEGLLLTDSGLRDLGAVGKDMRRSWRCPSSNSSNGLFLW